MDEWKSKWLTSASRNLILKSVISAIPVFFTMCLKIPRKVIKTIGQRMRKFFCNGASEDDKLPLLAWNINKICSAKEKGGAGIRDWQMMNEALGAKLV